MRKSPESGATAQMSAREPFDGAWSCRRRTCFVGGKKDTRPS